MSKLQSLESSEYFSEKFEILEKSRLNLNIRELIFGLAQIIWASSKEIVEHPDDLGIRSLKIDISPCCKKWHLIFRCQAS